MCVCVCVCACMCVNVNIYVCIFKQVHRSVCYKKKMTSH